MQNNQHIKISEKLRYANMLIDSHAHIFSKAVIENVAAKTEMAAMLGLETDSAGERTGTDILLKDMQNAGINYALILPTANAANVNKVNTRFIETASQFAPVYTAGTLHPDYEGNTDELKRFRNNNIKGIKLCSFSQGFSLIDKKTLALFDIISNENKYSENKFFIVLDTFYNADKYFGTDPHYNTKPDLLADLAKNYPGITFIGAHMGGLNAPFNEIIKFLPGIDNICIDTSNAAHTLDNDEFVKLLKAFGPERVMFGTDWPWFGYEFEIDLINKLLNNAGFSEKDKAFVFCGNAARLLGIQALI